MAIFTNTITKNEIELPVYEGYGLENSEYMNIFTEALEDDLAVIEAMHGYDMAEILGNRKINGVIESKSAENVDYKPEEDEEIGELKEELQTTLEAEGEKAKSKFRQGVEKVWAKIKAFFASVVRFFKNLGTTSKEFLGKNKKYINNIKSDLSFEYEMYNWNIVRLTAEVGNNLKKTNSSIEDLQKQTIARMNDRFTDEDVAQMVDKLNTLSEHYSDLFRGTVVGETKVSAEEYSDKLFNYFRGENARKDGKKPATITKAEIAKFVGFLEKADTQISNLNSVEKEISNKYKDIINTTNGLKFEHEASGKKLGLIRKYNNVVNGYSQLVTSTIRTWASAVQACANDYKVVIRKAITKSGYASI